MLLKTFLVKKKPLAHLNYPIYSAIRSQICKLVLCDSAVKYGFLFQNNSKDLDPSYKRDLDLCDYFRKAD